MNSFYDYPIEELEEILISDGQKKFRATQVFEWVYRMGEYNFENMTNIGKDNIAYFKNKFDTSLPKIEKLQISNDGTRKYLFELNDGNFIESVLMQQEYGYSICVSSQVGCNMGCAFCASGMHKKVRNLSAAEMVMQVVSVNEDLKKDGLRLSHIVVMGIGEPFDNYDNLLKFLKIVNYAKGLEIGARHITVSTSGLVPKIKEFASFPLQINLAISLHFPNDNLRSKYMPVNKSYGLEELFDAIKYYYDETSRRVTFEYILLDGINDGISEAYELVKLVRGMNAYINLIPMNETSSTFRRSSEANMKRFYDILVKNGLNVTLRKEKGHDIDAACGQLRLRKMDGSIK